MCPQRNTQKMPKKHTDKFKDMEHQLSILRQAPSSTYTYIKSSKWKLFIDGASRGNPGPSGSGVYIICNDKPLAEKGIYLGTRTNNQAEYLALALGLFFLKKESKHKNTSVVITSDSELLVRQMKSEYRIKDKILQQLKRLIDNLLEDITPTFKHVLRINNKKADALANQGIDKKTPMPKTFQKLLEHYVVTSK